MRKRIYFYFIVLAQFASDTIATSHSSSSSPSSSLSPLLAQPGTHNYHLTKNDKPFHSRRPSWLPSFSKTSFQINTDNHDITDRKNLIAAALKYCQYGIIAYLAVEVFLTIRDTVQEIVSEEDFPGFSSSTKSILSPIATKNLITWMKKGPKNRGIVPNISPSWMISVAVDLYENSTLSWRDLERILSQLTKSQAILLQTCLLKPDRNISFNSIGGLDEVKQYAYEWISFNTDSSEKEKTPYDQFVNQGRQGMVLWGPPGCGKSLLIQAMARKSRLPTLVVTPSLIQSKYFGESTNKVRSLFGLASVLGPCLIVLDELDGLFLIRGRDEQEASRDLKTEWLQWWDGVASAQMDSNEVLVVAATNRPWDVDPAVWRRLPQRLYIGTPTYDNRLNLLHLWKSNYQLPPIDNEVLDHFASLTEGYTPSDLHQIFQSACRKGPMARQDNHLTKQDVEEAEIPPTRFTMEYIQKLQEFLSPHAHQNYHPGQGTSMPASSTDDAHCLQMPEGNYYQFQIPVDSKVLDALEGFLWSVDQWDISSDVEEYDEEDSEEGEL
jgi:ATP-dependent 26S proteasome regulatory subunit